MPSLAWQRHERALALQSAGAPPLVLRSFTWFSSNRSPSSYGTSDAVTRMLANGRAIEREVARRNADGPPRYCGYKFVHDVEDHRGTRCALLSAAGGRRAGSGCPVCDR